MSREDDWVFGEWTILDSDRDQRGYGTLWTLRPFTGEGGVLCRGPFGRKAKGPESVIHACGYYTDGIAIDDDFLALLLERLNQ
jgi:hypothetical protein